MPTSASPSSRPSSPNPFPQPGSLPKALPLFLTASHLSDLKVKSEKREAFLTIYDETLRARAADPFEEGTGCESTARRPGISREAVGKRRQAYRATGRDGPPGMGHGTCGWEAKVARLNSLTRLLRSRSDSSPSSKSATHLIWAALEFSRNQSTVSFEKYMDLALERNCPASALDLTAMVTPPSRWPCRIRAGSPGRRRRPQRGLARGRYRDRRRTRPTTRGRGARSGRSSTRIGRPSRSPAGFAAGSPIIAPWTLAARPYTRPSAPNRGTGPGTVPGR